MEELFQMLNSICPLSDGLKDYLLQNLKPKELARKEILLKAGHISSNIYFVEKGILRCFYVKDGKEVCSWIMKEGDVIASVESFFLQKPTYESIQALEDCTLHYVSYQELQHIYKAYPEFNAIGRVLTEKYYILAEKRLYSLRMHTGPQKMDFLLTNHPDFIERGIEEQHLASYLNISRQYFSILKPKELKRKARTKAHTKPKKKFGSS